MRKLFFSIIAICTLSVSLINAQEVKETVEPFQKSRQPAFSITLNYSKNIVEGALNDRLNRDQLKGKIVSGFMEYIQVNYPTLCDENCNFYTKVIGNSLSATIYIFVSTDSQHFVSSGDDVETAENIQNFLKSVILDVDKYSLKLDIEEQDEIVTKAEIDYSKLRIEQEKLTRRQRELEKELFNAHQNDSIQKGILVKLKEKQLKQN